MTRRSFNDAIGVYGYFYGVETKVVTILQSKDMN